MNKGLLKGIIKREISKKGYKITNRDIKIENEAFEMIKDKYVTEKEIKELRIYISNCINRYIEKAYISWRNMHFRFEGDCRFETFINSNDFRKCKSVDIYVKNYRDERLDPDVLFIIDNYTNYSCLTMPTL
jgi:hypothetical protein|nr:MAG TPA: hypothetical protein [Caudoviricetes sp.]